MNDIPSATQAPERAPKKVPIERKEAARRGSQSRNFEFEGRRSLMRALLVDVMQ